MAGSGERASGLGTAVALIVYSALVNLSGENRRWYVARNAAAGAVLVAAARRRGLAWEELGLSPHGVGRGLRVGARVAAAATAVVMMGAPAAARHASGRRLLGDRRATLSRRELWWQTLVRIPFGTAAFEEVAFRGVLLGLMSDRHRPAAGLWASSATFGLWHVAPTLAALRINDVRRGRVRSSVAAVCLMTIAGVALGRVRLAGGHVAASWLVHAAINVSALVAAAVWQSARTSPRAAAVA